MSLIESGSSLCFFFCSFSLSCVAFLFVGVDFPFPFPFPFPWYFPEVHLIVVVGADAFGVLLIGLCGSLLLLLLSVIGLGAKNDLICPRVTFFEFQTHLALLDLDFHADFDLDFGWGQELFLHH